MRRRDGVWDPEWDPRKEDSDPPATPRSPFNVTCSVSLPADGATLEGPWNGVTATIAGHAGVVSGTGSIERIEVQVGAGDFKPAVPTAPGWASWTHNETITSSGTVQITARAVANGQTMSQHTLTILAALAPKPVDNPTPAADTTPPEIVILEPQSALNVVLDDTASAVVAVAGTATDVGQGVDRVELVVDGIPTPASPSANGWSNWTAEARILGTGRHEIQARVVDASGLSHTTSVRVDAWTQPPTRPVVERLLLVEKLRLSTYLGAYGAGRMIKTLSLLPGETTKVAVKTYRRSSETSAESASLFDENTQESQHEFEKMLTAEQTNKRTADQASTWSVSGEAGANWGWGSASIKAGATGASNAAREELAKNVSNAVNKHAAKAASKRHNEVKTSREMKVEEGQEFSSESQIENLNVGRTLNFVFRQMNQEYITILHLVDVRVAYVRGDLVAVDGREEIRYSYREVTLSQLDSLLGGVIVPDRVQFVRDKILEMLSLVFDHLDEPHALVEERLLHDSDGNAVPNGSYFRIRKGMVSTYTDPATQTQLRVPGVILSVMTNVMPTDGVVCDAVLGQGEALDDYSRGLQTATVAARELENERALATIKKEQLAMELVRDGKAEAAGIFKEVYVGPQQETLALLTAAVEPAGNGNLNGND